jgi:hypothetical protein
MRRTAAIVSALAAVVLLALTTPATATAATDDRGFLCGLTGSASAPRADDHRRESTEICATVVLPDLPGLSRSS